MLPLDLEDWLTDAGDAVVRIPDAARSEVQRLIYEIWLLDTEVRNGGVSQYFANRGIGQWKSCIAATSRAPIPSFAPFAQAISRMIAHSADPYDALIELGSAPDDAWDEAQVAVVTELRAFCDAP